MDYAQIHDAKSLTYDWNGNTNMKQINEDWSDVQVAATVRMLMRDQLNHEMVCQMARDRIMALSKEVARLKALQTEAGA